MQPVTIAGPHLKCYINNTLAGYVTSIQYTVNTAHRKIDAIDNIQSQELAVANYEVSANIGLVSSRILMGLEGAGITTSADKLPILKYLSIVVLDKVTDRIVFEAQKAVVESQSWTVQAKGLLTGQFAIKAIGFSTDATQ